MYRGGSASFEAYERRRGRENNRRDNREIFEFHKLLIDQRRKKETHHSSSLFGKAI